MFAKYKHNIIVRRDVYKRQVLSLISLAAKKGAELAFSCLLYTSSEAAYARFPVPCIGWYFSRVWRLHIAVPIHLNRTM